MIDWLLEQWYLWRSRKGRKMLNVPGQKWYVLKIDGMYFRDEFLGGIIFAKYKSHARKFQSYMHADQAARKYRKGRVVTEVERL